MMGIVVEGQPRAGSAAQRIRCLGERDGMHVDLDGAAGIK